MFLIKMIWLALTLVLVGCVPVQPQQDLQAAEEEQNHAVVVEEYTLVSVAPGSALPSTVEVIGGDEESLRAFVTRWFSSPYPGAPSQDTKIYIGELPPDKELVLPLPPGAQVLGSVAGHYKQLQIFFDSELDPEKIFSYYDGALGADWRPVAQPDQGQGFVMEDPVGRSYCLEDDQTYLALLAFPTADGPTDVRLNLDVEQSGYFCIPSGPGPYMDVASQLIPTLKVPAGVELVGGTGMGSSGQEANSTTNLKTTMTASELEAHFATQLQNLGWQLQQKQSLEGYAASAWRLMDAQNEPWMGTLIILEVMKDSDRRYAYLQVEKIP